MSSTQKWRAYGGQNNYESHNSVSFNNLAVNNLSVKNDYIGLFSIQGPLTVTDYAQIHGNLRLGGDQQIYGGLSVVGDTSFNQNVMVGGGLTIYGSLQINGTINIGQGFVFDNDINVNGNIGMSGRLIYMGPKNPKLNYGKIVCNTLTNDFFMGVNQPIDINGMLPGSTFEIYSDISNNNNYTAFHAHTNSYKKASQSVVISNDNYNGTAFYTDTSSSSLYMFNDHVIPNRNNSPNNYTTIQLLGTSSNNVTNINPVSEPDGELTYQTGGNFLLRVANRTFIASKTIIGKRGVLNTTFVDSSLNEKAIIYTDPSNAVEYNYPYYEKNTRYISNNALTLENDQDISGSVAGLNLVTTNPILQSMGGVTLGMKICGGNYILDQTKAMGAIGLNDDGCGNFIPVQMMVTGNNPAYRKSSMGINTYAPNMDNYSLNINGKTCITDGEITTMQDLSFQMIGMASCARNPSYIVGYGSPNHLTGVVDTSFTHIHPFAVSSNGGSSWIYGDISGVSSNAIHGFTITSNYVYSYDSSHSFTVYTGSQNYAYSSNAGLTWHLLVIGSSYTSSLTTTSICALDMSNSVMVAYTDVHGTTPTNFLCYGTIPSISLIDKYSADGSQNPIPITGEINMGVPGTVTSVAAYDSSYIFVSGSFGILKYNINPILGTINISPVTCNIGYTGYNASYVYRTYNGVVKGIGGTLNTDPYFAIFVGYNIISVTRDGGSTFTNTTVSATLNSVHIYDLSNSIAVGIDSSGYGIIFASWDGGASWKNMATSKLFNSSGVQNLLTGNNKRLDAVCMSSLDNFLISRIDNIYNPGLGGNLGKSKIFYCHFPSLFNIAQNTVLDICGSAIIDGYMSITHDLAILGSISAQSGNVLISQAGNNSYSVNSGTLVLPNGCGAGISGNVFIGGNVNCSNITSDSSLNLYSNHGNVYVGGTRNVRQNITIGDFTTDSSTSMITINGNTLALNVKNISGTYTGFIDLIANSYTNVNLKYNPGNVNGSGLNFYLNDQNTTVGYMNTTMDGSGFIFWGPTTSSTQKVRLDTYKMTVNTSGGYFNNIVSLIPSPYTDSSYVIVNQANIDVSNLILTTGVNAIGGVQTIATDISVNGNLFVSQGLTVSGASGVIKISGVSTESTSTGTGSLVISGGIGISGAMNLGGSLSVSNTTDSTGTGFGALAVTGGAGIGSNLYVGNRLVVSGNTASFGGSIFINTNNGLGPTNLSMTDFSSNVIFHSTTDTTGTGYGSVVVSGGVGIAKGLRVGSSGIFGGELTVDKDVSLNGNLWVNGGNIYLGSSLFFGPDQTQLSLTDFMSNATFHSTTESTGTGTGSIVVYGGVGIAGNIFVGRNIFFSDGTKLSMTDFSSNVVFHSTTDSNGTGYGSVVISGGLGIGANLFVGRDIYFGSSGTHLSMTDYSSNVVFHSTSNTIGTGSGSVVVSGGVGIGANLYVGNGMYVDGSAAYFANSVYVNSRTGFGPTILSMTDFSSNVVFHSTADSTSTGVGSIVVSGGVGIGANLFIGGGIYYGSNGTHLSMTDFSSNAVFYATSNATSTGTGSVVVKGGIGVSGNLYLGGGMYVDGSAAYFANNVFINSKNGLGPTRLSMTDFSSNAVFYSTTNSIGTGSGAVVVSGGVGIGANLYVGKGLTVDGSYSYFGNNVYINSKYGGGPTLLSMTDFSSNVVFHSNVNTSSPTSGAVVISGGLGVGGNINIGGYAILGGGFVTNTDSTFNGNLYAGGYYGGTTAQTSVVNFGKVTCYSLQSLTTVNISGGLILYGANPGTPSGGTLSLTGNAGIYSTGSIYCSSTAPIDLAQNTASLVTSGGAIITGNLYVGGSVNATAYNQHSDYRIKDHIEDLDDTYTVDSLRPVRYHNRLNGQNEIGFLANEIQEIYPDLVSGEKDGDEYQSLNYISLIGILVKEIKDLKRKISELK